MRTPRSGDELTPAQSAALVGRVRPMLAYLGALRRRMELAGFPPGDPMFLSTQRAFDALQDLHVRLHYASCTSGVYRDNRPGRADPESDDRPIVSPATGNPATHAPAQGGSLSGPFPSGRTSVPSPP